MAVARIMPPARERLEGFALGKTSSAAQIGRALDRLIRAAAASELSLSAAGEVGKLLELRLRVYEVADLEQRLEAVEARFRNSENS